MITWKIKSMFFDREAVLSQVEAARRKNLSKLGAFIRQRAKSSIKPARQMRLSEMTEEQRKAYRRRVALAQHYGWPKPKKPRASSKPGEPPRSHTKRLRKFIYFGYDPAAKSVVVGPVGFRNSRAPEALESGGTATVGKKQKRTVTIHRRPYMAPAMRAELSKLPPLWADSVRG